MEGCVEETNLAVQPEDEKHEEEQNSPDLRERKPQQGLRIGHKRQPRPVFDDFIYRDIELLGFCPEDGEYHHPAYDACDRVQYAHDHGISVKARHGVYHEYMSRTGFPIFPKRS